LVDRSLTATLIARQRSLGSIGKSRMNNPRSRARSLSVAASAPPSSRSQ
jgi:hypothetical protein